MQGKILSASILSIAGLLLVKASVAIAAPVMSITEYMYNGLSAGDLGEFVEFTNMSGAPIDMTGWSFDDNTRTPGSQSLSAFGVVQPGESVVFTDDTATNFRTRWGLSASVKIIGGNTNNIGRSDELNLYSGPNATTDLVDRLTYNDQVAGPPLGGPRTAGTAAGPLSDTVLGTNVHFDWRFLTFPNNGNGDPHGVGTIKNTTGVGEIGNPGSYVPEPGAASILIMALALTAKRRRA